jgi:hypothetical protein
VPESVVWGGCVVGLRRCPRRDCKSSTGDCDADTWVSKWSPERRSTSSPSSPTGHKKTGQDAMREMDGSDRNSTLLNCKCHFHMADKITIILTLSILFFAETSYFLTDADEFLCYVTILPGLKINSRIIFTFKEIVDILWTMVCKRLRSSSSNHAPGGLRPGLIIGLHTQGLFLLGGL